MTTAPGIVLLNWNGWPYTLACLQSLERLDAHGAEIVVVDNGSTDDSVAELRGRYPHLTVLETGRNLGFAAGCNVGIRYLLERGAAFVWILNNDTTVDPRALSAMLDEVRRDPRIGIVGSVVRFADHPEDIQDWGGGTFNWWTATLRPRRSPGAPDYITGASMLLRRELLEDIGLFDETFFFYKEDVDIARRAAEAGWRLVVAEDAVVFHKGGASINHGSAGRSLRSDRLQAEGSGILIGKHSRGRLVTAVPIRLAGIVVRRARRRQFGRIPVVAGDFLRGVRTGMKSAKRNDASLQPRVVFVDHCAKLSGGEIALARVLPALSDLDVRVRVILGEDGPFAALLREAHVAVEVLPLRRGVGDRRREDLRGPLRMAASAASASIDVLRLARRLRRLRPDVVHTNSLKSSMYGGLAGRLAGVPVVWHVRDRIASDYLPESEVRLVRKLARVIPAGFVANSGATLATLDPAIGTRPAAVVHDSVEGPGAVAPEPEGPFTVAMIGRIAPWKGQHVFLEAFAKAFPAGEQRAIIVGAPLFGEDAYEAELHELVDRLGVGDRVEFAGFTRNVNGELARSHVVVHSSTIPEPFGLVVVEAMAAGRPVVAARAGGPAEVVEHGVTGFLYDPGDVSGIADALVALDGDPGLRERIGRAASEQAAAFTPERSAEQIADLYRRVLGPKGPR